VGAAGTWISFSHNRSVTNIEAAERLDASSGASPGATSRNNPRCSTTTLGCSSAAVVVPDAVVPDGGAERLEAPQRLASGPVILHNPWLFDNNPRLFTYARLFPTRLFPTRRDNNPRLFPTRLFNEGLSRRDADDPLAARAARSAPRLSQVPANC
jgi:hypothetical protein